MDWKGYFLSGTFLAGFLLLFFVISGITLISDSAFGWTVLAILAISALLFFDISEKLLFSFCAGFFLTLGGLLSLPVAIAAFLAAAFSMELLFRSVFKHHAPLPDLIIITLGIFSFLIFLPVMGWIGFLAGFSVHAISLMFLLKSALYAILLLPAVFLALAGISNYSRYGSLY